MTRTGAPSAVPVLEVGGSHVTAAVVDLIGGRLVDGTRRRVPLRPDADADTLLTAMAGAANGLSRAVPSDRGVGTVWGLAVPGPFDYATGVARYRDVGKFASLAGVAVGEQLTGRIRPRPTGLRFVNDASAFALGAWRQGAAAGARRLVAITLGTGVGSAFLADGEVVEDDPRVPPEGRADLLSIDGHPLEDTVSTRAIIGRYAARTGRRIDGLYELTRRTDDAVAVEVVTAAMRRLGVAMAPWFAAFGADTVVFGGSITGAWALIGPPLADGMAEHDPALASRLRVTVSPDSESSALLGAAVHAARPAH
ncbi:MAG: ROK family protein [Actinocatenispora sp.]